MKRRAKILIWTFLGGVLGGATAFLAHPRSFLRCVGWPARKVGWFMAEIFAKGQADKGIVVCCITAVLCFVICGAVIGFLVSRKLVK